MLGWLAEWIVEFVHTMGYVGVAVLVALENVFPPIPSELILPLGGFLAGQGRFWLPGVVLAATAGSVLGALVLYFVSRKLGEDRLREFVKRYGRFLLLSESDLDRTDEWFDRHAGRAVFVCRLIPALRGLISIPAGLRGMPLGKFILFTTLGSTHWNSALIGLGWIVGHEWEAVSDYAEYFGYAVLAVVIVAVGWFIWHRRQRQVSQEQQ
jgi:membrane protein DedA with SNARE-associated domain